jgi:HSP20 family protein
MTPMIVRRQIRPATPLSTLMDEMTRDFFAPVNGNGERRLGVALNVIEDAAGYTVHALVPGVAPEALEINLENQVLTIKGEFKQPELPEGARYHMSELTYGSFERSVKFPQHVNPEAVEASYENGLLRISLPRAEAFKARRITVRNEAPAIEGNNN